MKKSGEPSSNGETWKENRALSMAVEMWSDANHWTEEEVLQRYEPWLFHVIDRTTVNLPKYFKANIKNDIEQEARIALLLCWRDYQKKKAVCKFSTFSFLRIRGSIIDFFRTKKAANDEYPIFVEICGDLWEGGFLCKRQQEKLSTDIDICIDLVNAFQALETWEQNLVSLHYSRGETLKEIGDRADVTEGRACQVHADILQKLRQIMDLEYS